MNIDEMKIGDFLKLSNMFKGINECHKSTNNSNIELFARGEYVIVRCYGAGVHAGYLEEYDPISMNAILKKSRRLWKFDGAFTLSEVALNGITDGKLAVEEPIKLVTEVKEITPCSAKAKEILSNFKVYIP